MVVFTLALIAVAVFLFEGLERAFVANTALNSVIIVILASGIVSAFSQMARLSGASSWIAAQKSNRNAGPLVPVLMPLHAAFDQSGNLVPMTKPSLRAMLEGVYSRIDDARDVSRYLMNTLILLGLLGTFWGLLQTVSGIGTVLGGLSVGDGDLQLVFERFKEGLQTPLVGMGISFSASLFGLASSLILGFFDLTTGRVQTRLCEDLEDWLSGAATATTPETAPVTFSSSPARYQDAMVQTLAEQLERLQRVFRQQEESREAERVSVRRLAEGVSSLDDHIKSQQHLLAKLAELQQQVSPILVTLNERLSSSRQETIEEHTRRIDVNLAEIGERVSKSADSLAFELREELKIIAKLLASSEASTNA
jgi:hypothetical protein